MADESRSGAERLAQIEENIIAHEMETQAEIRRLNHELHGARIALWEARQEIALLRRSPLTWIRAIPRAVWGLMVSAWILLGGDLPEFVPDKEVEMVDGGASLAAELDAATLYERDAARRGWCLRWRWLATR